MSDTDWLACDNPTSLWTAFPRPSRRVAALFAVACVRLTPQATAHPLLIDAAEAVERVADTGAWDELGALNERASRECHEAELDSTAHYWALAALRLTTAESIDYYAVHVPFFMDKALAGSPGGAELGPRYAALLRDAAGRPGRNGRGKRMKAPTKPHPFPVLRASHHTEAVVAVAAGIYAEKAFDRLPVLADALEDAGCEDSAMLDHCRGPGPHSRGCWVVDLVLGKE